MAKFKELKTGKNKRNKSIYRVRLLENKPKGILTMYEPHALERLDNISYKFYGDPKYWYVIARANNIANGKFLPEPGMKLRIPQL